MVEGADGIGQLVHEITVLVGQSKELEDATQQTLPTIESKPPVYLVENKDDQPSSFQRDEMDGEKPF